MAPDGVRVGNARQHAVYAVAGRCQHAAQLLVLGLAARKTLGEQAVLGLETLCAGAVVGLGMLGKGAFLGLDAFDKRKPFGPGVLGNGMVFSFGGCGKLNQLLYPGSQII